MGKVKIARIPDNVFYNDEAMLNVNMGSYEKTNPIDFNYYKQKLAGIEKNRPKLAEIMDDRGRSRESSQTSAHTQTVSRREQRFKRENSRSAVENGSRSRQFKVRATAKHDTNYKRDRGEQDQGFPWENRMESIKQLDRIIRE